MNFRHVCFCFFLLCFLIVLLPPLPTHAQFFRTVAETLDAMKYHDAGAFVQDVRLIFDNARKYNPPKHPIHVAASKLSKVGFGFSFCFGFANAHQLLIVGESNQLTH